MEPAIAGAAHTGQSLLAGAAALFKGMKHPTLPLKANLTRISSVPLARSHHTVSVVKGRAYIFGGEDEYGRLASNDMHIVILPSSGVLEADYTAIQARAANGLDDVPEPRRGHTAVVIGDSIYIFGGEGESVGNERGRIWVYHTVPNTWSILDPASNSVFPSHRSGHVAASSNFPAPKTTTFRERAPQAPVDPAQNVPEPAGDSTWGTIFVVGGRDTSTRQLSNDALAFDLRTRIWSNIPSPAGQPREGASLALVGNHLYRFGGKGVETFTSGAMESLDVSPVWKHAEGGTTPLSSGWAWEEVSHQDSKDSSAPRARSNAGLAGLTTGQGRQYLVLIGGEGEATGSNFLDDIWTFQLPSDRRSAAAAKDDFRAKLKKGTHESKWAEVQYKYIDTKGEEEREIPGEPKSGLGTRGHFGIAKGTEVDGATCVVWGGVDAQGRVLEDGWMITLDR